MQKKGLCRLVLVIWLSGLFLLPNFSSAAPEDTVVITEVLSNCLVGEEDYNEFIELYNYGNSPVDVYHFIFTDGDSADYIRVWEPDAGVINDPDIVTETTTIPPKGFAVILDQQYDEGNQPYDFPAGTIALTTMNSALGNGLSENDPITLFDDQEIFTQDYVVDTFGTPIKEEGLALHDDGLDGIPFDPGEGNSLGRIYLTQPDSEENWRVSESPTPGGDTNDPPEAKITASPTSGEAPLEVHFSGLSSIDPEARDLTYRWEFPDGTTVEEVETDKVFDEGGNQLVTLTVSDGELEDTEEIVIEVTQGSEFTVRLNEILPNPEGSDLEGEFVELYNYGDSIVNLSGYKLDDEEGGSNPYTFPEETTISPGGYLTVCRTESKLALNNDQDRARLLDSTSTVIEEVPYQDGDEGWSYSYHDGKWSWTNTITPGEANQISGDVLGDEDQYQKVNIEKAKTLSDQTKVSLEGVLTVEPGVFSEQYCYFQDGNHGLKVYFSKSDFPTLKLGDKLKVRGKMSTATGERKINLSEKSDIEVIGGGKIDPKEVKTDQLKDDQHTGMLITVQGEVSRSSGKTFYLDDGSGEGKISVKDSTGIKKPETKKGTELRITGIVNKTTSGNRLLPRYQSDFSDKLVSAGIDLKIYLIIGFWLFVILNCLVLVLKS